MILNIFLIVVFLATALALFRDGLWSALVMLLNILLATTVASAWYETVARLLDAQQPSYTYLFDFFSIWGLFALVLLAMREITDRLSRTKVKFVKQVEMVGAPLVASCGAPWSPRSACKNRRGREEYSAAAQAVRHACPPIRIHVDHASVFAGVSAGRDATTRTSRPHADPWRML